MLFSVSLQVPIKVYPEIECEFILVFKSLTLFFVEICSVYVDEQILRLVTDESSFFMMTTVYLDLEVELLVKCSIKTTSSWVENQTCKITDHRRFFLQFLVIIIFSSSSIKHILYGSLSGVKD